MTNRLMRLLIVTTLLSAVGPLGPSNALAQNEPANGERYLIILKPQKNGVPDFTDRDVTAAGGRVDFKAAGRVDVTLPASAVEALRKHGRVKYIQKATLGPPPRNAAAASVMRLKPAAMSLHSKSDATPPTWLSGTYLYDTSGNIYAIGIAGDTGAPAQHRYAYDNLSRLTTANTTALLQPNETFVYDNYGNMTSHTVGSTTTATSVVAATNRLTAGGTSPYQYDALGNLTADAEATYAYDPFSMLREKDYQYKLPEFYIYTASDERIGVKYGSLSDSVTTWSIRDFGGNVLRQFKGMDDQVFATWLWVEDYIYRDGQLLGAERVPEEGGRRHFHLDHLGSPRLVTSSETSSNEMSEHDFAPFGTEVNPLWQESVGGFDREDPKRFTGHERDYASDGQLQTTKYLDYMHARYYNPGAGRFLTIDPQTASADTSRPQTWNRYIYAANNPVKLVDPNGQAPIEPALLQFFRAAFGGGDFSNVDVHDWKLPLGVGLTLGENIFLDSRNWQARNPTGISLLAHELDHNIEQRQTGLPSFVDKYQADITANHAAGMSFENAYVNSASEQRARVVENHVNAFLSDSKNRDIAVSLQTGRALDKKQLDRVKQELAPVLRQQSATVQITCTDAARTNCRAAVQPIPVH
jgi:RHS repeat-associated protein